MDPTNVWVTTQSDGSVRADQITDLDAHQTPASARPLSWPRGHQSVAVDIECAGVVAIAVLVGEIDTLTAPAAQATVADLVATAEVEVVVVDLSAVTFLSSRGIQLLVDLADLAREHSVQFRVVTGVNRAVLRPLEITYLHKTLPMFTTRDHALPPAPEGSAP